MWWWIKLSAGFLTGAGLSFIIILAVTWVNRDPRCDERILWEGIMIYPPGHYDCRDLLTRANPLM